MAKTMEHLSEFVFINVANMTLARRHTYLAHVKAGIKLDTLSALRQAPIHLDKLFPDQILKRAEENIAQHENKGRSAQTSSNYRKGRFHHYQRSDKGDRDQRSGKLAMEKYWCLQSEKEGQSLTVLSTSCQVSVLLQMTMCKVSALKRTDRQQTDFKLCSVPPDRTRVQTYCKLLSASCELCKLKCCF